MRLKQAIRDNLFEFLNGKSRAMLNRAITRVSRRGYKPFVIPFKPHDVDKLLRFMDAAEEIPTVRKGMDALGMTSLAEWIWKKDEICIKKSPYTADTLKPYIFIPGLTATMFFDRERFEWIDRLESNSEAIRNEVAAVLEEKVGFQPYRIAESGRVDERWKLLVFYLGGKWVEQNVSKCPTLREVVESIPRRAPHGYIMLSALNPGHTIDPHYGIMNGMPRVHFGLFGCNQPAYLRVGTQIRQWEDGKAIIFDDAFQHQVCHNGDKLRVVLWFDVRHPDWPDDDFARFREIMEKYFMTMEWYLDQERDWDERLEREAAAVPA